jgi:hypothetical protein
VESNRRLSRTYGDKFGLFKASEADLNKPNLHCAGFNQNPFQKLFVLQSTRRIAAGSTVVLSQFNIKNSGKR